MDLRVRLAVARGQPSPAGEFLRPSETPHLADLGHEHRREHRADATDLLDRAIATMPRQQLSDHVVEPSDLGIQHVQQLAQR